MADQKNFLRGVRFRELVAAVLAGHGIDVKAKSRAKLSTRLAADDLQTSDVLLADWSITTAHTARGRQWSAIVDGAERAALADRRPFFAAIIMRPDRSPADQYALTTVATLAALMTNGLNPQREK